MEKISRRVIDMLWPSLALLQVRARHGNRLCVLRVPIQLGRPLRQMIERCFMRAIEMERSYGSSAIEDRGVITFRIEPIDMFLFVEPVEGAPTRVGPLL